MPSNEEILKTRTLAYEEITGPRVGDYVVFPTERTGEYERKVERISHNWGDSVQTSPGGSWYLGEGFVSFSGALNPSVPKDKLSNSGETKLGRFWFFKNDYARAFNGIEVEIPCRVFYFEEVTKCGT